MNINDTSGSQVDPSHDNPGQGSSCPRPAASAHAERRRAAFQAFLERHEVSSAEVARRAGMPTANALYNFMNGWTDSLAQSTLEKISQAFPDTRVDDLIGQPSEGSRDLASSAWPSNQGSSWPILSLEACAGVWRPDARLPLEDRCHVPVPLGITDPGTTAFGVRIKAPGAELICPSGSIAVCLPLPAMPNALRPGCRLVVRRERAGRHEITLRELVLEEGRAWLWPRSTHPEHQAPIAVPWPLSGPARIGAGDSAELVFIEGVVIATWQFEAVLGLI